MQLLVNVDVDDIERGIEFYRVVFDFDLSVGSSMDRLRKWSAHRRRSIY